MSHELRTPLNVIVGYNDLLLDGAFGEMAPEQAETLGRVQTSAYELLELINATLDMSRLESGRLPLDLEDVCVQDLIAEIDAETRALRDKPGIRCVWDVPAECAPLRTDRVKLKVILKNLVGNAVKFTEAGTITISARRTNGQVEFRIADTGIGIAPETRAVIFEPFRQADGSATRRYGGVGLGLYIVRRLLEILGGAVAIDSEVGKGSTFRVSVPDRWA
jgi:signal transduction histidine kinase